MSGLEDLGREAYLFTVVSAGEGYSKLSILEDSNSFYLHFFYGYSRDAQNCLSKMSVPMLQVI